MKISDVLEILVNKEKEERKEGDIPNEMEAGQLYGWQEWKLAPKDGELFLWSDDVTVETILSNDKALRMRVNEIDKMKVASVGSDGLKFEGEGKIFTKTQSQFSLKFLPYILQTTIEIVRTKRELNREMFQKVGITPNTDLTRNLETLLGTPRRGSSSLDMHLTSHERKWTICPSVVGDALVIKEERHGEEMWKLVLFGIEFHSTFHVIVNKKNGGEMTMVCMTRRAQVLLNVFPSPFMVEAKQRLNCS